MCNYIAQLVIAVLGCGPEKLVLDGHHSLVYRTKFSKSEIRKLEARRIRCIGHIVCMVKVRHEYRVYV